MAGGVVVAGGGGKDYPGRFTFNVFITCLAAAVGGLIFGYDLGISVEIRSAAMSINVAVNMIFTFAIAQVFTLMLCHLKFGLFIVFGVCVVIMNIFIYKFFPETKGVPIEEMTIVWKKHPYWSKFYDGDDSGVELPSKKKTGPGLA